MTQTKKLTEVTEKFLVRRDTDINPKLASGKGHWPCSVEVSGSVGTFPDEPEVVSATNGKFESTVL